MADPQINATRAKNRPDVALKTPATHLRSANPGPRRTPPAKLCAEAHAFAT
jgi:hypothetical protein